MKIYFPRIFSLSRFSLFYVANFFMFLYAYLEKYIGKQVHNKFTVKTEINDINTFFISCCLYVFQCTLCLQIKQIIITLKAILIINLFLFNM